MNWPRLVQALPSHVIPPMISAVSNAVHKNHLIFNILLCSSLSQNVREKGSRLKYHACVGRVYRLFYIERVYFGHRALHLPGYKVKVRSIRHCCYYRPSWYNMAWGLELA